MRFENMVIFATQMHWGQKDKVGDPYILHVFRVMLKMRTQEEREVALLHDVIEDAGLDDAALYRPNYNISREVAEAVICISRRKEESYPDFIRRCKQNNLACRVKIADLEDHLEQDDITHILSPEKRLEYIMALVLLKETR